MPLYGMIGIIIYHSLYMVYTARYSIPQRVNGLHEVAEGAFVAAISEPHSTMGDFLRIECLRVVHFIDFNIINQKPMLCEPKQENMPEKSNENQW
jgi:hypothetical protein